MVDDHSKLTIGFVIKTWDNYWSSLSNEEKDDILNLTSPWKPNPNVISDGGFSKVKTMIIAMGSAHRLHKEEQLEDCYRLFTARYNPINPIINGHSLYENILLGIWSLISETNNHSDKYFASNSLAIYYHTEANDIKKAILYYRIAYNILDAFLPVSNQIELDSYGHDCFMFIQAMIQSGLFEESIVVENETLSKGLFSNYDRGEEYLFSIHFNRTNKEIEAGRVDLVSDEIIESFNKRHPAYAANICKEMANYYYKNKSFVYAKRYYEKARFYYPSLSGIKMKLKTIEKTLNLLERTKGL